MTPGAVKDGDRIVYDPPVEVDAFVRHMKKALAMLREHADVDIRWLLKEIDRLRAELADEGCPKDDPDCLGRAEDSHEACERP